MKREQYEALEIEIIFLDAEDVILTSTTSNSGKAKDPYELEED